MKKQNQKEEWTLKLFKAHFLIIFNWIKHLQIIYCFDGVELDDYKELDSTTHNNDDNLTNNNLNTKAEFMSILGESKEGL